MVVHDSLRGAAISSILRRQIRRSWIDADASGQRYMGLLGTPRPGTQDDSGRCMVADQCDQGRGIRMTILPK
jgi:hypothetical protein